MNSVSVAFDVGLFIWENMLFFASCKSVVTGREERRSSCFSCQLSALLCFPKMWTCLYLGFWDRSDGFKGSRVRSGSPSDLMVFLVSAHGLAAHASHCCS